MKTEVQSHRALCCRTGARDSFSNILNDGRPGDDAAHWLSERPRAPGIAAAGKPGREDFGRSAAIPAGNSAHGFCGGLQPTAAAAGDPWRLGWIERPAGVFSAALFGSGGRKSGVSDRVLPEAVTAMQAALASSPGDRHIVWLEPGTDAPA